MIALISVSRSLWLLLHLSLPTRESYYSRLTLEGTSDFVVVPELACVQLPVTTVAPPWAFHLHPHHNLWFIGGIVFCDKCGSICSNDRKSRLQEDICEPAKIGGPQRRIQALKGGTIKGTHFKVWPDGSESSTIKVPKRIYPFRKRKLPPP